MKATVIVQARVGSSRLPGKVLLPLPIGGKATVLEQVCRRAANSSGVEQVVAATTDSRKDDIIAEWAERNGYLCYRGSEDDVLDRYYQAAVRFGADPMVRITSDCPCADGAVISEMLRLYADSGADYVTNCSPRTFPHGLDAEIFSFAALKRAWVDAASPPYREHVTPYIYNSGLFKLQNYVNNSGGTGDAEIRVTLDTREDYVLLCAVYVLLGENFSRVELVNLFKTHGWLRMINEKIRQKKLYGSVEDELKDAVGFLRMQDMPNAAEKLAGALNP